jgi:hypothetical protein
VFDITTKQTYKEGDLVFEKLDTPEDALGHKLPGKVRSGDYTYSRVPKKIVKVLCLNDKPYYRYLLDGISNASFSEAQLIKSDEKEQKHKIKKILDKKTVKKIKYRLVWWQGEKKSEATWEPESQLIEDGLKF